MRGPNYTEKEISEMVEMFNQGATFAEIAELVGRSTTAVQNKMNDLGYYAKKKALQGTRPMEPETVLVEGKTLVKMKTLDDYPARDLIKNLFDRGYRIENNKLYYIHKKEVNLADCCR